MTTPTENDRARARALRRGPRHTPGEPEDRWIAEVETFGAACMAAERARIVEAVEMERERDEARAEVTRLQGELARLRSVRRYACAVESTIHSVETLRQDGRHAYTVTLASGHEGTSDDRLHAAVLAGRAHGEAVARERLESALAACVAGLDEVERRWDGLTREAMTARAEARALLTPTPKEADDGE